MLHDNTSDFETPLQLRTVLYRKLRNYLISAGVKSRKKDSVYVDQTPYSPVFYLGDQGLSQFRPYGIYDYYTDTGSCSSELSVSHLSLLFYLSSKLIFLSPATRIMWSE
jgi:hypothetical protein